MLFSAISGRGLFFDIPSMFLAVLQKQSSGNFYYFCHVMAPENFSNRLLALPYNILTPIFNESILDKLNLYTFSCLLTSFLATMFNFVVAKRTQKFEIASFALFFYALFTIPMSCYPKEATLLAIPMFFILLQYFWTEEKVSKFEYLFIILLSGYMFQSSSNMIIPCILLALTGAILFLKGHVKHWKIKLYITLASLGSALYLIYRTFFAVGEDGSTCTNLQVVFSSFCASISNVFSNLILSDILISVIAVFFFAYGFLRKKDLGKKEAVAATIVTLFTLYSIYEFTKFQLNPFLNINYIPLTVLLFALIVFDINLVFALNIKYNKEKLCNNLIKTACVCGIVQCLIQYGSCINALEYKNFLLEKMHNANGLVSIAPAEYKDKPFLLFDSCEQSMIRSLMLSDKNVKVLIVPNKDRINENKSCLGYNEIDHAFDEENPYIIVQSLYFPMNNKYWNFNDIVPLLNNLK